MKTTRHVHKGPAAVYVLQRLDRSRFKLGWAINPVHRAQSLPEYAANVLDLENSVALWLPSRQRAEEVEACLHKGLAPYHVNTAYRWDGYTEWFSCRGLESALNLLHQMPLSMRTSRHAPVLPLLQTPDEATQRDSLSAHDVWWALEDLLKRVANCLAVRLDSGEAHQIIFTGFRHAPEWILGELRSPMVDIETYHWRHEGRSGSFVSQIHYDGDDLVLTLTTPKVMARWKDGSHIVGQVSAYLQGIRQGRYRATRNLAGERRHVQG